jgi:hypothetical protein
MMYRPGSNEISERSGDLAQRLEHERQEKEELGRSLWREATVQIQKTIEGFVALPAALALTSAATALFVVGFLSRGLDILSTELYDSRARRAPGRTDTSERERQGAERRTGGQPEMAKS